ncbi:hypothetical protein EVAR_96741_1 [Eumeta japonica]|uniref:Uncharacterized protein n=1 Tax=Eumeta variegata TaxID=151549 RepID=A0A4C1Y3W8_EUMVA|nr:hypothetical protein EVAR_96741_1 [Eumeta japonica]
MTSHALGLIRELSARLRCTYLFESKKPIEGYRIVAVATFMYVRDISLCLSISVNTRAPVNISQQLIAPTKGHAARCAVGVTKHPNAALRAAGRMLG